MRRRPDDIPNGAKGCGETLRARRIWDAEPIRHGKGVATDQADII